MIGDDMYTLNVELTSSSSSFAYYFNQLKATRIMIGWNILE